MTSDLLGLVFDEPDSGPPAGDGARFGGRWRLVSAGLSDVWRYGDLQLPAPSGRLLMRGPNGTGKTTALEILWPYLLDLNSAKLAAGRARWTSLKVLMSEGHEHKRRYGYVWLTFASPTTSPGADPTTDGDGPEQQPTLVTYGVRLQYSEGGSPAVKAIAFTVPGQPLDDVPLRAPNRSAFELEQFSDVITSRGGQVFVDDDDSYVAHLATHIWGTTPEELRELAGRIRAVRNPSLLGEVSPKQAADALRASLPGVDQDVLSATADALAASDVTREAFARDSQAATVLADFAQFWAGHVTDIVKTAHSSALDAATVVGQRLKEQQRLEREHRKAHDAYEKAEAELAFYETQKATAETDLRALEKTDAYLAGGQLTELERTATAQARTAATEWKLLDQQVGVVRGATTQQSADLAELVTHLEGLCEEAALLGADPVATEPLLSWTHRPRLTVTVGDQTADPGPGLAVTHDVPAIDALRQRWTELADTHRRRAQAAGLAVTDHQSVATAEAHADKLRQRAEQLEDEVDEHAQRSRRADSEARAAATATLDAVRVWAPAHPDLRGITHDADADAAAGDSDSDSDDVQSPAAFDHALETTDAEGAEFSGTWDVTDGAALDGAEPAHTLGMLDTWATLAVSLAATSAARDEQQAHTHKTGASQRTSDASDLRRQASQLRAGQLLPLPRPNWAAGDDSAALGALLEWHADLADTGEATDRAADDRRSLLEVALAASGLLAATLTGDGARTSTWVVTPTGPVAPVALDTVLSIAPDHPLTDTARAVLSRIGLVDSAVAEHDTGQLLIGKDGTFRAGVLTGDAARAATEQQGEVPAATHIGAGQRLEAARQSAQRLDEQADELHVQAAELRTLAGTLSTRARQTRQRATTFPSRKDLIGAESTRVSAAQQLTRLEGQRTAAGAEADAATRAHRAEHDEWVARTRGNDLPADLDALKTLASEGQQRANNLTGTAGQLATRVQPRLSRLLTVLQNESAVADTLARLKGTAETAHTTSQTIMRTLEQLRLNAGHSIAEAQAKHARLTEELREAAEETGPATTRRNDRQQERSDLSGLLDAATLMLSGAQPAARATLHHLQLMLAQPAVADVLTPAAPPGSDGHGDSSDLPDSVVGEGDSDALLERVERLLTGRRSTPRKLVADRYDRARVDVAHTWTIARGDAGPELPELDLYVLTHDEHEYTPTSGAGRARELATRAEQQLAEDEQAALNEFVIGRLPSAINNAWTKLLDWRGEVNSKMRSAAASSGVGVQVETQLRPDLNEADRIVYDLCCRVTDANRLDEQKQQVGRALQSLIAAATGENMLERLANAVDIRNWVDLNYLVTRPGKPAGRWSPRTGLSGGERRLVVLAPMLAAIAASYDRLGQTGLRLAALDEVPAEVDERGREGLARYLAQLDLDLICTSYLWDGSPGAWDGIDAHDLEAGPDGTVVAFPMLVRGLLQLPGDPSPDTDPP